MRKGSTALRKKSAGSEGHIAWPDIHVVDISLRGMVFRSHQAFDLGDSLSLGLHICVSSQKPPALRPCGDFLKIEGVVVDCRVISWGGIDRVFEITVSFPLLAEEQGAWLVAASRERHAKVKENQATAGLRSEAEFEFESVVGLN
ncbi:MAG: hypothetical protein ACR2OZ_02395 [Verrucomicrobiales bacterium]